MAFRRYNKKTTSEVKVQEPEAAKLVFSSFRGDEAREGKLYEVKSRIHHLLLERLDLSQMENLDDLEVAREIRQALEQLFQEESEPINLQEKNRLIQELEFEILGLGPLEPLLTDPTISDILVNRYDQVYIERRGQLGKDPGALPGQQPPAENYQ